MKIAVTYSEEEVFQHFGRTEAFKLYEIENSAVVSSGVISTGGTGHEALADFLAERDVDAVICGGLGGGAQAALSEAGIVVISGAEGDADAAVEAFLRGELTSRGVNCDHHHDGEEEHHCGGGCGGCHGCHSEPTIEGPNAGRICVTHYRGTFNDGTEFDSSYSRGEPLEFICGVGQMIPGFDRAVANMAVGESVDIHLMPEEAYGETNPELIFPAEIAALPGAESVNVGDHVYLYDQNGRPVPVAVIAKDETMIYLDANHEMAGKELNFHIELVELR